MVARHRASGLPADMTDELLDALADALLARMTDRLRVPGYSAPTLPSPAWPTYYDYRFPGVTCTGMGASVSSDLEGVLYN